LGTRRSITRPAPSRARRASGSPQASSAATRWGPSRLSCWVRRSCSTRGTSTSSTSKSNKRRCRASCPAPPTLEADVGGKQTWFFPDGYLPGDSSHGVASHEAACVLNTGIHEAQLAVTFYFEDGDPVGPVHLKVGAGRTRHIRLDDPAAIAGIEL